MVTSRTMNMMTKSKSMASNADPQTRSPYVIKACEECRRRKIRCNGSQPCRRCDRLSLVCFYRAKRQHNSHPEQSLHLQGILAELNALRAQFHGLSQGSGHGSSASGSPPPMATLQQSELQGMYQDGFPEDEELSDPLLDMPSDEIHRLVYVYDEHVHFFYPTADMDATEDAAAMLIMHRKEPHLEDFLCEADAACLRVLLSNAMIVDEQNHGDLPTRLFESALPYLTALPGAERLDIKALRAIVLTAQHHFVYDRPITAWRYIGFAVRTATELGLNLQRNVDRMFPTARQRHSIRQLWYSIYILDHCWSLHMGLGPASREVDSRFGIAEPDETMPFLRAMLDCTRIISRAWDIICPSVNQIDGLSLRAAQERLEDVYREIREWQNSTAVNDFYHKQQYLLNWWQLRCLKTFLYLRANELCIFLCKPILVTRNSMVENRGTMEFATTLAKDSILVLVEFYQSCSGMRILPFVFNQFLSSALATMFLAIIQEPHRYNTREGDCRAPIHAAKKLVEELEAGSFVDRKFYRSVKEDFIYLGQCRILGRDPEKHYSDVPAPTTEVEFNNALIRIEPLLGRVGHSM